MRTRPYIRRVMHSRITNPTVGAITDAKKEPRERGKRKGRTRRTKRRDKIEGKRRISGTGIMRNVIAKRERERERKREMLIFRLVIHCIH